MPEEPKITIHQARTEAMATFRDAGIDSASLDARVLMAHVLGETQTGLLMRDPDPIPGSHLQQYRELVAQRATGVPVAYLTGHREFMGLPFATTPGVLVPRPDTEPLVEWGLNFLRMHQTATVVDIGTGSGAIAISLIAHADPNWRGKVIATDLSAQAIEVAKSSAGRLLTPEQRSRLEFALGSLTESLVAPIDLLLANLPYLTPDQIEGNPDLRHEPILALDGGADGLDLVRRVIADLSRVLSPGGAVGFEIDPAQSDTVQELLAEALPNHRIEVVYDLAGNERHVTARPYHGDPKRQ